MPNNVYIGSRYVPLFDGAWDNTKSYEPLTIVEYGNNSYTSKKPGPAGTLPTDTSYWALTGNYNGQIASLQTQINVNASDISDIMNLINREFMFFGDSYGETYVRDGVTITGWFDRISGIMGVDPSKVHGQAISGYGFCGASGVNRWYDLLSSESVNTSITDCCFIGGTNDVAYAESSTLVTTIESTIALAKTKYPNARIWVGFCSLGSLDISTTKRLSTMGAYSKESTKHGAIFMDSLEYCLYNPNNYGSAHPNNNGTIIMASAISSILKGGVYENVIAPITPTNADSDPSITPNTLTGDIYMSVHQNKLTIRYKGTENNRMSYRFTTPMDYVGTGNSSIILAKYTLPIFSQKVRIATVPVLTFWTNGGIIPGIATINWLNGYYVVALLVADFGASGYYNANHTDTLNGFDFQIFTAEIDMLRDSID